ncbi:unnamed protein product [Heterobilharzia americana]|nr:unnamed protein product [Heterobilharzia americana]
MLMSITIFLTSLFMFVVQQGASSPISSGFRRDDINETTAECDACMAGMDLVHYIVSDQYWVETYVIVGRELCETIPPGTFQNACKTYVNTYLPHALTAMAAAIQPQFICHVLQACKTAKETVNVKGDLGHNVFCEECKLGYKMNQSVLKRSIRTSMKQKPTLKHTKQIRFVIKFALLHHFYCNCLNKQLLHITTKRKEISFKGGIFSHYLKSGNK